MRKIEQKGFQSCQFEVSIIMLDSNINHYRLDIFKLEQDSLMHLYSFYLWQ